MKHIFIPLTIDASSKQRISIKQLILLGITIVLLAIIIIVYLLSIGKLRDFFLVKYNLHYLGIPVFIYLGIVFTRKVTFREGILLRASEETKSLSHSDLSFTWNIFTIKDSQIYYCNGWVGSIVSLQHGFLIDRPPEHEAMHRNICKSFMGTLASKGYIFIYYNREVQDSNLGPLLQTEQRLECLKESPEAYNLAHDLIRHVSYTCRRVASTEQEYYLVIAPTIELANMLKTDIDELLASCAGSLYSTCCKLNDSQIIQFLGMYFGLEYIDVQKAMSAKFKTKTQRFITVTKTVRNDAPIPTPEAEAVPVAQSTDSDKALQAYYEMLQKSQENNEEIL